MTYLENIEYALRWSVRYNNPMNIHPTMAVYWIIFDRIFMLLLSGC